MAPSNTQRLGPIWKGRAWDDGFPVSRLTMPDDTVAEANASLLYVWNGSAFVRLPGDDTNGLKVQVASGGGGSVTQGTTPWLTSASNETGTIYSGSTALTPKFATISTSNSGGTTVVAAVTAKKLRVINVALVANAAVNVKFQSHTTPTDKTGLFYLAANGGFVMPYCPVGWFETAAGEALDINLSGAVAVGGSLAYIEV